MVLRWGLEIGIMLRTKDSAVRDVVKNMAELLHYMQQLSGLESGSRAFTTFVLEHGREWVSSAFDLPSGRWIPRACYHNCQAILLADVRRSKPRGFIYVEGYACSAAVGFPFVTEHAWLVDRDGRVIDPTWDDPERSAYFGVPFRSDYVREVTKKYGRCSLIDNFRSRWELVRNPDVAAKAVLPLASRGSPQDRLRVAGGVAERG